MRYPLAFGLLGLLFFSSQLPACYFGRQVVVFDNDRDGFDENVDCNDRNASVFPGAVEVCDDGIDNDCDGKLDLADPECGTGGSGGTGGSSGDGGTGGTSSNGGAGGTSSSGNGGAGGTNSGNGGTGGTSSGNGGTGGTSSNGGAGGS